MDKSALSNPRINILKNNKGYNFQFLLNRPAAKPDTINPWKADFTGLLIKDAKIKYKDLTQTRYNTTWGKFQRYQPLTDLIFQLSMYNSLIQLQNSK